MKHETPLTELERTTVHDYGSAGRISRGRFYGWTGGKERLPKIARSPGDYLTNPVDSTPIPTTIQFNGQTVPVKTASANATADVNLADLQNASTVIERVLEMSSDGGQTWRVMTKGTYRAIDGIQNSLDPVRYQCVIRSDLAPTAMQFRSTLRNLGPSSVTADCGTETNQ